MAAPSVAVTTAGDLRTSVCRVVIYLQRDMSGESCLPQPHTQSHCISPAPPLTCPKTKACSYRGAVGLGNKYVRLNVGGALYYTTLQVLTRQDSMLRAMFSGKKEVFTDKEGRQSLSKAIQVLHEYFQSSNFHPLSSSAVCLFDSDIVSPQTCCWCLSRPL